MSWFSSRFGGFNNSLDSFPRWDDRPPAGSGPPSKRAYDAANNGANRPGHAANCSASNCADRVFPDRRYIDVLRGLGTFLFL
jgi:hypothetical protein